MYATLRQLLPMLLILLLLAGCGKDDPASPNNNNNGGLVLTDDEYTFDVEWNDGVQYFNEQDVKALKEWDDVSGEYTFDAANATASAVEPGDVIVVYGIGIRKVVAVTEIGTEVVLTTEEAVLTDAVKNGTIAWDTELDYAAAATPSIIVDGVEHAMAKTAENTFSVSYKIAPYTYTFSMEFQGDKATVTCGVKRKIGNSTSADFTVEGVVETIRSKNVITVENNLLAGFEHENSNLRGDLTATFTATSEAGGEDFALELPAVLLKYPFLVGPIPVVLNVRAMVSVSTIIPLGGQASAAAKFSYDTKTGFNYNGADINFSGVAGPYTIEKVSAQTGAVGSVNAEFGLAFPRIELQILGKTLVPYIQTVFLVRGDFFPGGFGEPACQRAYGTFAASAGYNFSVLGVPVSASNKNLFFEQKEFFKEGCN